ncbi:hypothetical protein [Streptomyces sp. NPDC002851]
MRRAGLALSVAAAILVALSPGTSLAGDRVRVDPAKAVPGEEVAVTAAGCEGTSGAAKSEAFVADATLTGPEGEGSPLSGEAMIRSTVELGRYDVTVSCDGKDRGKGKITIVRDKPSPSPSPTRKASAKPPAAKPEPPAAKPKPEPPAAKRTSPASPTAPMRAGGGGTAETAAAGTGDGTTYALIGGLLVAVTALALAARVGVRSRRSR